MNIQLQLTPKMIDQLRRIMDGLPLNPYAPLICAVNKALPLESDASPSTDTDRQLPRRPTGGFAMMAVNDKGKDGLAHLARVLGTLEVES